MVVESWPDKAAFEILDRETAITMIPNLLASGIATLVVSALVVIWSVRFLAGGGDGLALIGLSALLLLVGGGSGLRWWV